MLKIKKHRTVLTPRQLKELISGCVQGIDPNTPADIAQYMIGRKTYLASRINHAILGGVQFSKEELWNGFDVTVDYTLPFKDTIEIGRYDRIREDIFKATLPSFEVEPSVLETKSRIRLYAVTKFAFEINIAEEIKRKKCRSANIYELFALGAQHPVIQRAIHVTSLGARLSIQEENWVRKVLPMLHGAWWGGEDIPERALEVNDHYHSDEKGFSFYCGKHDKWAFAVVEE